MSETIGHKKLKKKLYKILKQSGFEKYSLEVLFTIPKIGNLSADVIGIEGNTLFIIQCKDRITIDKPEKEFGSLAGRIEAILDGKVTSISCEFDPIVTNDLNKIKRIKACYAFTDKLKNNSLKDIAAKFDFLFWDDKAVRYYEKTANTLEELTKYQILKEFGIPFESPIGTWEEPAVKITQEENSPMYLLGIHPSILLEIGYVYRRGSGKSDAYQRIVNKDRVNRITEFYKKSNLLLANPVIIVFDSDKKIQNKINYREGDFMLEFPRTYCCAWIIDGQHRIFGFKDHEKYSSWSKEKNEEFKIPVVAFENLPEITQSRSFVDINYYQKRIDPSLFADLSTLIQDLKYPITWPNLLVEELNQREPWKNLIKISELDKKKPISNNAFANIRLLDTLLGYKKKSKERNPYSGVLYELAPFEIEEDFASTKNQRAFKKQINILQYFFQTIRDHVKTKNELEDRWLNNEEFGLTNRECVNALLLVLNQLLKHENNLKNWEKYVPSIDVIDYDKNKLLRYGRGYPAFSKIANQIIRKINRDNGTKIKQIRKKPKKKRS